MGRLLACFVLELVIICADNVFATDSSYILNERKIMIDILRNYESAVRPVMQDSDAVPVRFDLTIISVEGLDAASQVLAVYTWLHMEWKDVQLTWNTSDYGGLTSVRVPVSSLWTPDVILYNSAMDYYEYSHKPNAVVKSDGTVLWIPVIRLTSHCSLDLAAYPNDVQRCNLTFGSWTYDTSKIDLTMGKDSASLLDPNMLDHEWTVEQPVKAIREVHVYSCCVEQYATITYTLVLTRNAAFVSSVLDSSDLALVALTPVMFVLPPACGEKITLGMGLLLYNALMCVVLSYFLPTYHQPSMPSHAVHLVSHLVFVSAAIILAALINTLWHKQHSMPAVLRRLTKLLAYLTCVTCSPAITSARQMSMRRLEHQLMGESDVAVDGGSAAAADGRTLAVDGKPAVTAATTSPLVAPSNDWQQLALALDRVTLVIFVFVGTLLVVVRSLSG